MSLQVVFKSVLPSWGYFGEWEVKAQTSVTAELSTFPLQAITQDPEFMELQFALAAG